MFFYLRVDHEAIELKVKILFQLGQFHQFFSIQLLVYLKSLLIFHIPIIIKTIVFCFINKMVLYC